MTLGEMGDWDGRLGLVMGRWGWDWEIWDIVDMGWVYGGDTGYIVI